ncbi:MAG: hypothetical protein JXM69_12825 [Anaerolineae bacterium]|nr:hypothetical protein [Anaerolineae bacterium]
MDAGGISLQIAQIDVRVVTAQFLIEAKMKAVGNLDNTLNDERYSYVTLLNGLATPWYQHAPLKPIRYAESVLNIQDLLLVYPIHREDQTRIQLMPHSERAIVYVDAFVVHGDLSMGADMTVSNVIEGVTKRFMALTNVSIFPLFPAGVAIPEVMPLVLLNRSKLYQLHPAEG